MFNDAIDDQPQSAAAAGFVGMDCNTPPTVLEAGVLADGSNLYCRGDGAVETRPGLRINTTYFRAHQYVYNTSNPDLEITGVFYFDTPSYEATIFFTTTTAWAITGSGDNLLATEILIAGVPPIVQSTDYSSIVQLVDRIFYLNNTGRMCWLLYTAGVWTNGSVATFSSSATIPALSHLVVQGFRVMALEALAYRFYASAIGTAHNAADWVSTENIRVGNGEGDPPRTVLATQAGYLTVLNGRSVYQILITASTVAAWSSFQVCRHTGCINGQTAVVLGQDVYFLSRYGVVNLGALQDTMSIAPQDTLSYPIQSYIDRINWSKIETAFATTWNDMYLIALPLDSEDGPTRVFAYHLILKRWMPPWVIPTQSKANWLYTGVTSTWTGLKFGCVTQFADKSETLLIDSFGQFFRLDATAESDQTTLTYLNAPGYNASYDNLAIPQYLRTRDFTHDMPAAQKQPFFCELEFIDNTATGTIDLVVLADGAATVTTAPNTNTVGRVTQFTPAGGQTEKKRYLLRGEFYGRNLTAYRQAGVQLYRNAGKMALRSAVLSAFVDSDFRTL